MKAIILLKWGQLCSLCNVAFSLQSQCLETGSTVGLSGDENKMCFLPLVRLLFLQRFYAVGLSLISALEVEGRDVPVLLTSSQGTGSGLDSGQGHLFLKKLETSAILLCLFRRSKK